MAVQSLVTVLMVEKDLFVFVMLQPFLRSSNKKSSYLGVPVAITRREYGDENTY